MKATETRWSRLESLGATNEAAGNADPSQVNVLLEPLARLEHEHAQYKGATTNTERNQEEVLRETQDQVDQLGMRILKNEEDSRGLMTRDHNGQIEARVQALKDLAKKTEGPKISPARGQHEGFDRNAVAHLEGELVQVKFVFPGANKDDRAKYGCPDGPTARGTPQPQGSSPDGPRLLP